MAEEHRESNKPSASDWFLYIVLTEREIYYTGITTDVARRFQEHCDVYAKVPNAKGAKFFRGHRPVKVVYSEKCVDRSAASKRERQIKSWSRTKKLHLINSAGS